MIFVTGDTHGDFSRFTADRFPAQKELTKNDFVIICGDFGIWSNAKEQSLRLEWLDEKPFTTLFVSGNHENYDLLASYPVSEWNGGKVQFIKSSVIHLMRGQVFTLDDRRFFTMGGAASHDIGGGILEPDDPNFKEKCERLNMSGTPYRVNHVSWWKEELPNAEEYAEANRNLACNDWKVDFVISHCAPTSVSNFISGGTYRPDELTDYLEQLKNKLDFRRWYFGHYHTNLNIGTQFVLLYEKILWLSYLGFASF